MRLISISSLSITLTIILTILLYFSNTISIIKSYNFSHDPLLYLRITLCNTNPNRFSFRKIITFFKSIRHWLWGNHITLSNNISFNRLFVRPIYYNLILDLLICLSTLSHLRLLLLLLILLEIISNIPIILNQNILFLLIIHTQ